MHLFIKKTVMLMLLSAATMAAMAQQTVKGTVTDKQGVPVIGASVTVNGKAVCVTDAEGRFTLPAAEPSQKIELSYLGYKSQTVSIGSKSQISIVLEEDSQALNEVVVVGYGTMRKIDLTGSVGSVNNSKLNEKGAASVLENLQGSVPGVNITKSSGRTGGGMNIEIRGKNSLSGSQSPLYVVDGIICSNIDFLNPQDIERIDVLKDASSTAIYGSRATAGVVMVTTKSGTNIGKQVAKPTISYDGYYGVSKVARMPEFQSAEEFYNYRFMKFLTPINGNYNNGQPVWTNTDIARCLLQIQQSDASSGYRMKQLLEEGNIYDWPDLVLQNGKQQNHYLAISGGSQKMHYHIGLHIHGFVSLGVIDTDQHVSAAPVDDIL
ncbi:MAG: TonB-dependent receptor plug domain-containing protein, partial [Prevotella sp.]|nr:TonB-dependent receptor plug domain-containing protein [Prevotella sp.]